MGKKGEDRYLPFIPFFNKTTGFLFSIKKFTRKGKFGEKKKISQTLFPWPKALFPFLLQKKQIIGEKAPMNLISFFCQEGGIKKLK